MKVPFFAALCGAFLALSGCVATPAQKASPNAKPDVLLLISIDGYRPDYLDRHLSPTLQALADTGVRAQSMQPAFPSLTFPNHYTIVTGRRPDDTGMVANAMVDPVLGKFSLSNRTAVSDGRWWNQAMPLWETAQRAGIKAATMFWPGSEAAIHGVRPTYWNPFDARVTPNARAAKVLAWLDLPPARRPGFITLYFDAVDHAGHVDGPDSPQLDATLRQTDAAMAMLIDGLKQRGLYQHTNIIVVSDHGMAPVADDHEITIDTLLPLDQVTTVGLGVLAGFNPKPGANFARIEKRMEQPQAHMQCWDKTRVPARFHYGHNPRVPQLLCLANVGWRITTSEALAADNAKGSTHRGDHGYDNRAPSMQALFVAHGPAFKRGETVGSFPNLDVYPLMAHLLHLTPAANDGDYRRVRGMLKAPYQ